MLHESPLVQFSLLEMSEQTVKLDGLFRRNHRDEPSSPTFQMGGKSWRDVGVKAVAVLFCFHLLCFLCVFFVCLSL